MKIAFEPLHNCMYEYTVYFQLHFMGRAHKHSVVLYSDSDAAESDVVQLVTRQYGVKTDDILYVYLT